MHELLLTLYLLQPWLATTGGALGTLEFISHCSPCYPPFPRSWPHFALDQVFLQKPSLLRTYISYKHHSNYKVECSLEALGMSYF